MEYRTVVIIKKDEDKKRITAWQGPSELDWLEKEKKRIQDKNKRCEILKKYNSEGIEKFALFYIDGYYKSSYKEMNSSFVGFNI